MAGGLLPIAPGSDGAGSIRIPASFCGLVGLKPSRGRVANAFGLPDRALLYSDGPLARSVGDAAALLDVLAGVSAGKPHWAPAPPRPFAALCEEAPAPLRIKLVLKSAIAAVDPEVAAVAQRAARALEKLGHMIRWSKVQPITRWLRESARQSPVDAVALRRRLEERFLA